MKMMQGKENGNAPDRKLPLLVLALALVYYLQSLNIAFLEEWLPEIVMAAGAFVFMYTFAPVKEYVRKCIVALKRKPQTIPLLVLAIAFLVYSLNLTQVSNTTAKIYGAGMGLSGFCTMLFSMLSFVCFLNAYPHRKPTNVYMLAIVFGMLILIIVCDTFYMGQISKAISREVDPIAITAATIYIQKAFDMLKVHRVIVIIGAVRTLLVPVLRKLLRKINTSLPVEENAQMGDILLSDDN